MRFLGFFHAKIQVANKKMPNTDFDLPSGIGLANDNFRAVFREFFLSENRPFFVFFKKIIVK